MMNALCGSFDEIIGVLVLEQALKNPRSSVALNEWMDEKLDNRMEAFTSVNRFLRDMVDKLEIKNEKLEMKNAELQAKIEECKHQNEVNKHLMAQIKKLETRNDQLLQQLLPVQSQ